MHKLNVAAIAGMLAFAAVLGTIAATHTVSLGTSHRQAASSTYRAQAKKLNRFEAALRRQLAKKPPRLPAVPKAPAIAPARAPQAQQQVVYRRPPAIVVVKHTHHGDDGSEHEGSDGGGGEGGDD